MLATKAKNNRHSSDLCNNKNASHYLEQPTDIDEEIKLKHIKFEEETKIKFNLNNGEIDTIKLIVALLMIQNTHQSKSNQLCSLSAR